MFVLLCIDHALQSDINNMTFLSQKDVPALMLRTRNTSQVVFRFSSARCEKQSMS